MTFGVLNVPIGGGAPGLSPKFYHFFAGFPKGKICFRHLKLLHNAKNLQPRKNIRLLERIRQWM